MRTLATWILALSALALSAADAAAAPQKPASRRDCFLSRDWDGWRPAEGGDVLYLGVNNRDVYRAELIRGSRVTKSGDTFLVNRVRGSSWICSPIDLQLTLSDTNGFRSPVLVTGLRKLTPEEAAALPKKERPF